MAAPREPGSDHPGRVSVVVPTRDAARTLRACLESVRRQDHPDVELVVVDNHSTDETPLIAARLADRVEAGGPERSAQRNRGVAIATGPWVMWVDADMVLPDDCISTALATSRRTGADAVALPEVTVGHGFWARCRALERSCYLDDPGLHNPRLLRRDVLERVGGFDESMSGPEDAHLRHLLRSAGVTVALAPVLVVHDEGRLTLRDVLAKRVYYGRSLPAFTAANPGKLADQGAGTLRAFLRHRRALAHDPGHAVGMLALRLAEAAAYGVGALQGRRHPTPGGVADAR
jgi:glycosyltransferase involved in cell wall biosynthesis